MKTTAVLFIVFLSWKVIQAEVIKDDVVIDPINKKSVEEVKDEVELQVVPEEVTQIEKPAELAVEETDGDPTSAENTPSLPMRLGEEDSFVADVDKEESEQISDESLVKKMGHRRVKNEDHSGSIEDDDKRRRHGKRRRLRKDWYKGLIEGLKKGKDKGKRLFKRIHRNRHNRRHRYSDSQEDDY